MPVTQQIINLCQARDERFGVVDTNCQPINTLDRAVYELVQTVAQDVGTEVGVPETGGVNEPLATHGGSSSSSSGWNRPPLLSTLITVVFVSRSTPIPRQPFEFVGVLVGLEGPPAVFVSLAGLTRIL